MDEVKEYGKELNMATEVSTEAPKNLQPLWKDLVALLVKIAAIAVVFVLLFTFVFGITRYQDHSMVPAIKDGDLVIFYRYTGSSFELQDTVILEYNGQVQVRRVVALAGDTVDIVEGRLVINGFAHHEQGIYQKTEQYQEGANFPLVVPEGQIFVLGDNRTDATDSRIYGCVRTEDTQGRVMVVIRRRGI